MTPGPPERRRPPDATGTRASDVLLTACQPAGEYADGRPAVSKAEYLRPFTGLGLAPFEGLGLFDPFLHEIVEVERAADPDEPVRITDVVWPGLGFGPCCSPGPAYGCGQASGTPSAAWPAVDLSQGWGHNSQWRTDFRVDLRTASGDEVNACGREDIDAEEWTAPALSPEERRELLRHRCLVRTPGAEGVTGEEFFPFDWRM